MARILSIYLDMFSSHYLKSGNSDFMETSLDKKMCEVGGTFFANCYTPAPDTGRSAACMWSGKSPRQNGCDDRFKWPRYFLNNDGRDIFALLKAAKYDIDIYCDNIYYRAGLFPRSVKEEDINTDFSTFLKKRRTSSDIFTFLYLPDLHHYLANWGYNLDTYYKACDFCCDILDEIFRKLIVASYDYLLIFGDHGFILDKNRKKTYVLDDCRIKTGVFIKNIKSQNSDFLVDEKLHSIVDIYATILHFAGIKSSDNGSLLFFNEEHESVMTEDHRKMSDNTGEPIANWKIVTRDNQYWVSEDGIWHFLFRDNGFNHKYWEDILSNEMTSFGMMRKLYQAQQEYLFGCCIKKTIFGEELKIPVGRKIDIILVNGIDTIIRNIKAIISIAKRI